MHKVKQVNKYRLEKINLFKIDSPLLSYSKNHTSQNGEDGIIEHIFEVIKNNNKYCVEFGAWDGKCFSNCNHLITKHWSGCFIEGNRDRYSELVTTYSKNKDVVCLNCFVGVEDNNSLDNILSGISAPIDLDFMSIDVDGIDYYIWEQLNIYQPRLLLIEFNPTIPNDVIFIQEKSNKVHQGCSLLSLIFLGKEKGYELICCTTCNAFFVKKEFYSFFKLKSNSIYSLYQPLCDGRVFHGYDSSIFVVGMSKLLWSNISIDSSDFQVLPKSMRYFNDAL